MKVGEMIERLKKLEQNGEIKIKVENTDGCSMFENLALCSEDYESLGFYFIW